MNEQSDNSKKQNGINIPKNNGIPVPPRTPFVPREKHNLEIKPENKPSSSQNNIETPVAPDKEKKDKAVPVPLASEAPKQTGVKAGEQLITGIKKSQPQVKAVRGKKKALLVSILAFLVTGGALFILMTLQGNKDLRKDDIRFSYGNVIKTAVAPLFEALGIEDNTLKNSVKERLAKRIPEGQDLDISDWLASSAANSSGGGKGGYSGKGGGAGGGYGKGGTASAPYRKMDAQTSDGGLSGGGGTSQSSSTPTKYEKGSSADKVNTSDSLSNNRMQDSKKGSLASLKTSKSVMGAALRTDSAAVASSKWGNAFGDGRQSGAANVQGGAGGQAGAYTDSGLVSLDKIKSGEIGDLKLGTNKPSVTDAGVPKIVEDDNTGDEMDKLIASTLGDSVKDVVDEAFGGKDKDKDGADSNEDLKDSDSSGNNKTPPAEYKSLAEKTQEEGGPFCPKSCYAEDGSEYKDKNPPSYRKTSKGAWVVTYEGKQTLTDGSVTSYSDVYVLLPGKNPDRQCIHSTNQNPVHGNSESWGEQL